MKHNQDAMPPVREIVLESAKTAVLREDPNFTRMAAMLNALGLTIDGKPLRAHHAPLILACLQLSAACAEPGQVAHWTSLAGFAAYGYEATAEQ